MSWFKADMDTHTAPPSGMGEKIGRAKTRKLVGWDKNSLKGKAKATHKSKAKQGIHSWLPMDRTGAQPCPGKQGSLSHKGDLRI